MAFLGTGLLGRPIAARLLDAGTALRVWNRTLEKARALQEAGAVLCATPSEAARGAGVVFVCVRDEQAVRSVLEGPEGVFEGAQSGAVIADLSTVGPSAAHRLRKSVESRGFSYVEVPVIGSGAAAETGTLVVLGGGEESALERVRDLLEPVSRRFIHCGSAEEAAAAKLAVNVLLGLLNQAIAEAYAVGKALGLPPELVLDALSETPASRQVERKRPAISSGAYSPSFRLELLHKDLSLAVAEVGLTPRPPQLLALQAVLEATGEAVAASWKDLDYSAMAAYLSGEQPRSSS